jgi:FlaG/FlaF family flagellin (archaellin)
VNVIVVHRKGPSLVSFVGGIIAAVAVVILLLGMVYHSVFPGGPAAVAASADPVVVGVGPHSVSVGWAVTPTSKEKYVSGFEVSASLEANNSQTFYSAHYSRRARGAVIRNLNPRTTYRISVTVDGGSSYASAIEATTTAKSGEVPTALVAAVMRASQVTNTSVSLKWYVPGARTVRAGSFALAACKVTPHHEMECVPYEVNLAGNVYSYTYSGLEASSLYEFEITAYGAGGSFSSSIKVHTKG